MTTKSAVDTRDKVKRALGTAFAFGQMHYYMTMTQNHEQQSEALAKLDRLIAATLAELEPPQ
jgi:hypothetical protein